MIGSNQKSETMNNVKTMRVVQPSNSQTDKQENSLNKSPWVLLIVITGLYLVLAFIQQHQKVRESLQPSNIAANFYNLLVIGISVILIIPLMKIAVGKLAAMNVPGAHELLSVVDAV